MGPLGGPVRVEAGVPHPYHGRGDVPQRYVLELGQQEPFQQPLIEGAGAGLEVALGQPGGRVGAERLSGPSDLGPPRTGRGPGVVLYQPPFVGQPRLGVGAGLERRRGPVEVLVRAHVERLVPTARPAADSPEVALGPCHDPSCSPTGGHNWGITGVIAGQVLATQVSQSVTAPG